MIAHRILGLWVYFRHPMTRVGGVHTPCKRNPMLCKSPPVDPRIMKHAYDVHLPTVIIIHERYFNQTIARAERRCLFNVRETLRADPSEKGDLNLACNTSNDSQ